MIRQKCAYFVNYITVNQNYFTIFGGADMESVTHTIGEIVLEDGKSLLKMWGVNISPGERDFVKHSHTRFEIAVVNSGEGKYTTEGAVYPMREGDVFVFSSNEVHCITGVSGGGMCVTNLHFEPRYLMEKHENEPFIHFCFSHSPQFCNRIPAGDAATVRDRLRMIEREFLAGKDNFRCAVRAYLELALIDLLRCHGYGEQEGVGVPKSALFSMLAVFRYIDGHLGEELCLADLSAVAGYSPNYFSHLFKQMNGFSLWDYITAKRVEKGVKLLTSGAGLTMVEIAMQCGFNNTVNFNKAFKKQKGMTPSALKRNPQLLAH